jgi:4-hydroxyphenylacetate 3-monooxygenase
MPNQSLLYSGRVHACSGLAEMMHLTRDLCGGQICVTPDFAAFSNPETAPWLAKFYTINENWEAEDRRRLLAYARDLLNSDYAGHRLTFQLFAQSPPFAHLLAVYRTFDFTESMRIVQESAGLSARVSAAQGGRGNGGKGGSKTNGSNDATPRSLSNDGASLERGESPYPPSPLSPSVSS